MDPISEQEVKSIFNIVGLKVLKIWRLPNQYYTFSESESDDDIRKNSVYRERRPWWLVKTQFGLIEVGPRKRVFSIDWSDTGIKVTMTKAIEKGITNGETFVHAYSLVEAAEFLTEFVLVANMKVNK